MATEEKNVKKEQHRKPQQKKKDKKPKEKRAANARRRVLPIWLRILIVLVLSVLALAIGLMIGYGVLGDGDPLDALSWSTWQQIIDIVTGD
ncbi:DNA-directed RNA polymerase subunit beta [Halobacillus sp. A5]|uniref:DNA-directed RNA polymerase subunit beta n=1 Tax=Halobacillus sp. A5 TaxID=2880263 RepID=UPI0020A63E5F|nr:DNA-directed RNA polymerase subunit beta [Halobacillus sp. A5]MCP3027597.1 DNA-directed RNA polymerase subunit beta [Halobacillus sp. A5]